MTDFELRRQLRELQTPREPDHDLWPQIARQIAARSSPEVTTTRRRVWLPLAAAAAMLIAVSAGMFSLAMRDRASVSGAGFSQHDDANVGDQIQRARELAASSDPRLVSAEVVLDAASNELDSALKQQPDAVFLVGLINRTHAQRRKLARLGLDAG